MPRPSRSEFHLVRGTQVHVRRWGNPQAPLLVLLHGMMDMSATFQFMVDALQKDWNVAAPDWPGFGLSEPRGGDYSHTGNIADLEALLQILSPDAPARLVAHSMGAQVASLYCGARPHRVAALASLDGISPLPPEDPCFELERLRRWLDFTACPRPRRVFDDAATFAVRLMEGNPRLARERAAFLARQFTRPLPDGRAELLADPRLYAGGTVPRFPQKVVNAALASFGGPVLFILGGRSRIRRTFEQAPGGLQILADRLGASARARQVTLPEAGHNLHHDAPEQVAALLEEFFAPEPSAR